MRGKKARAIRKMYGVKHVRQARQIERGAVDLSALKKKAIRQKRKRRETVAELPPWAPRSMPSSKLPFEQ